jgi:hypothetical protein
MVWLEHVSQLVIYVLQELQILIPLVVYIVYPLKQLVQREFKHVWQLGILAHKLQPIPFVV